MILGTLPLLHDGTPEKTGLCDRTGETETLFHYAADSADSRHTTLSHNTSGVLYDIKYGGLVDSVATLFR